MVKHEVELGFWKRVENLLETSTPSIGLLTDHQISIRNDILDLVRMVVFLAGRSLVVSKVNIVNHFRNLAPEVSHRPS